LLVLLMVLAFKNDFEHLWPRIVDWWQRATE